MERKGTNKEKSTWKAERMDEKMSTVLKLLYAMRESPRAWVIGEKSVERFIEALVENIEHRRTLTSDGYKYLELSE